MYMYTCGVVCVCVCVCMYMYTFGVCGCVCVCVCVWPCTNKNISIQSIYAPSEFQISNRYIYIYNISDKIAIVMK